MAHFYMRISSVSRAAGRRATAAAAYRAGERIRDERTGEIANYASRRDVLHTEIFLPPQLEGTGGAWARNRERLWNTAERAEKRYNSRVAREFQVTLPAELDAGRRVTLARVFAEEIAQRYKVAVDLAVHEPRPDGDNRNFHAHLLATTREVTPAGLGGKVGLDMSAQERRRHGLPDHSREFVNLRERWATLTNDALREANIDARVDHRSLAAQGLDREPSPAIPLMHLKMERRGVQSGIAERLRAEYQARVARRLEHSAARDPAVTESSKTPAPGVSAASATPGSDVQEIRRQAREAWLQLRAQEQQPHPDTPALGGRETPEHESAPSTSQQDDLAL